ncbi:hypothetical protein EON65_37955 [archaeon]|nr:MAG: hypothetical protein EON65_37955 [archaeon]
MIIVLRIVLLLFYVVNVHGLSKDVTTLGKKDYVFSEYCTQWRSKVLAAFPDMQQIQLPADYAFAEGSINKKDLVQYRCDAYQAPKLSYLRILRFEGSGFNVFNCVALPELAYDLPILGIDIVSLPGISTLSYLFVS